MGWKIGLEHQEFNLRGLFKRLTTVGQKFLLNLVFHAFKILYHMPTGEGRIVRRIVGATELYLSVDEMGRAILDGI